MPLMTSLILATSLALAFGLGVVAVYRRKLRRLEALLALRAVETLNAESKVTEMSRRIGELIDLVRTYRRANARLIEENTCLARKAS